MLKEFKYVLYLLVFLLFIFFNTKYYFSDENKKNSYRSLKSFDNKIKIYSSKLPLLKNDTIDMIEYVENSTNNKKKYHFWKLLTNNEK
tara:strand:- start:381 stop:644 length:264 start_codon:yes stop_codon:yes gene_type:complete